MGYFSELETMNANDRMETEPAYLEKLKSRLCYLEDKLASLESNRSADIWHDEIFADALPLYDYDEPDTASGLCKAISNIKKKSKQNTTETCVCSNGVFLFFSTEKLPKVSLPSAICFLFPQMRRKS